MSHVLEKNLDDYRLVRKARDSVDYLENTYYARRENPPYRIRQAKVLLEEHMMTLRAQKGTE